MAFQQLFAPPEMRRQTRPISHRANSQHQQTQHLLRLHNCKCASSWPPATHPPTTTSSTMVARHALFGTAGGGGAEPLRWFVDKYCWRNGIRIRIIMLWPICGRTVERFRHISPRILMHYNNNTRCPVPAGHGIVQPIWEAFRELGKQENLGRIIVKRKSEKMIWASDDDDDDEGRDQHIGLIIKAWPPVHWSKFVIGQFHRGNARAFYALW
uniref:Uncharacterized protein n=1 Tax=Globodera rostochiensis TaxID=31243 RepID=A0A914HWM9_GLORO